MASNRLHEILEEIKIVFSGRTNTTDAVLPPLLFLILNGFFGFTVAMWSSLAIAGLICLLRLLRKQPLSYAFGGLAAIGFAIILSIIPIAFAALLFQGPAEIQFRRMPFFPISKAKVLVSLSSAALAELMPPP